jgi:hypothetical protein
MMKKILLILVFSLLLSCQAVQKPKLVEHIHGVGHVHMDISCSPSVSGDFDQALALLHNFWYTRALEAFNKIIEADPQCAMAYWGAAMTYNHPFWDAPKPADESAAWVLVQKGIQSNSKSPREKLYLDAVAALFKNAGAGEKSERDNAYKNTLEAIYEKFPDDEIKLFYGLAILGTIKEGTPGFEKQAVAAKLTKRNLSIRGSCTI